MEGENFEQKTEKKENWKIEKIRDMGRAILKCPVMWQNQFSLYEKIKEIANLVNPDEDVKIELRRTDIQQRDKGKWHQCYGEVSINGETIGDISYTPEDEEEDKKSEIQEKK